MGKRRPKPEPFSIAELEEIVQSPALQGFEKVLQYRPVLVDMPASTVEDMAASTVEVSQTTTVEDVSHSTVESGAPSTVEDALSSTIGPPLPAIGTREVLWIAEGADGVFTSSRIKRVERAQDALTHVEEAVYDVLWGPKKREPEPYRLAQIGYSELAKQSRVSKRSIQSVIDRLLEKQFIEIDRPADITSRKPTVYRVLGYGAVLKFLRETGRLHVLRTGRGVFYARRLSTVEAAPTSTVDAGTPSTVAARLPSTVELASTVTVEARSPSTVEASSTGNTLGKNLLGTTSSSVSAVASRIVHLMPIDDDAVRGLIENCRQTDPSATDDEISYFTELWIRQNAKNTSIRKPVAVMLTAVPKFFGRPATELNRYREHKAREAERSRELAHEILADPDATEQTRMWARAALEE